MKVALSNVDNSGHSTEGLKRTRRQRKAESTLCGSGDGYLLLSQKAELLVLRP